MSRKGRIKVEGLAEMRRNLAKAGTKTREAAEKAVAEEVEDTKDDARRLAPERTGELRRKIKGDADGLTGEVKSTARHATFVEHGTYKDKAQPYMLPASALARRRLPKRAASIIKAALEEIR